MRQGIFFDKTLMSLTRCIIGLWHPINNMDDDLQSAALYISVSVISGQWEDDNNNDHERLCALELQLR